MLLARGNFPRVMVKYQVFFIITWLRRGVFVTSKPLAITVGLVFTLLMLAPCLSIVESTSELYEQSNYVLNLIYEAGVSITIEGSFIRDVLGLDSTLLSFITITVPYTIYVDVTLSRHLKVESCNLTLTLDNIAITPSNSVLSEFIQNITGLSISVENACESSLEHPFQALPLLVNISSGNITLEKIPTELYFTGILRLNIDIAVSKLESSVVTNELTNYTERVLQYEPLTGIPLYYSETKVYSDSQEPKRYTYNAYILLVNYANYFISYLARSTSSFEIQGNSTTSLVTVIIIYPAGNGELNISTVGNNITISFSNSTRCFLEIGPIPSKLEARSNINLKYYMSNTGRVFYTPKPVNCSEISIYLSTPLQEVPVNDYPEIVLPPQRPNPSSMDILASFFIVFLAMLLSYLIIDKVVNFFTKYSLR
jgi:hypothetical protein